jgi:hypothetical protein
MTLLVDHHCEAAEPTKQSRRRRRSERDADPNVAHAVLAG